MSDLGQYQENYCVAPAVVAAGQQVSASINVGGTTPVGVITPGTLVSTAMRFQVSHNGVDFVPLHDDAGARVSITVAAGRAIGLNPLHFRAWNFIQVDMGSAETGGATIHVITKPLA